MSASARSIFAGALVVVLATAGCDAILGHELNPKFCVAHPDDVDCRRAYPDAAPDGPAACASDRECSGATPVCNLGVGGAGGTNTCVVCTVAEHALCTGAAPACIDNKCEKCTAHAQCDASNVCLPDGSCADAGQVAYVDPAGTDNDTCTLATPCTKVAKALATNRPYVKFHGKTDEGVTVAGGRQLTFLADPGAELTRGTGGAILTLKDDATQLSIYDLSISDAPNNQNGIGCVIPTASGSPALSLTRAKISNNPGGGISASGGVLTIAQSTISNNTGGGVLVSGAQYDISNTFITANGSGTTIFGGVFVSNITTAGMHRFEFNTLATNIGGQDIDTGISCNGILVPLLFSNNIIYGNAVLGTGHQFGGSGNCSVAFSDIGPVAITGTGNINMDPKFINGAGSNYHLQAGSPAEDAADPAAVSITDFDGDSRPQGDHSDMGADEVRK